MSFLQNLLTAAAWQMNYIEGEPNLWVVVATGLIVVFSVLVILCLLITLEGKIFTAIDNKKKGVTTPKKAAAPKMTEIKGADASEVAALAGVMAASGSMYVEPGIPSDVVAAIAAAVASMDGGKYTLRTLTCAKGTHSSWNRAGVVSNTEPF